MPGFADMVLHKTPIEAMVTADGPVRHVHSMAPAIVAVPPLRTGSHFFETWPVRELPVQGMWARDHYTSYAPPVFVLHNVLVHSSAGILAIGNQVISETLAHTSPQRHAYRALSHSIALPPRAPRPLPGIHISLLAAGEANYRHTMLNSLARLTALPENYLTAAASILVPQGGFRQKDALQLLDLLPSLAVHEIGAADTYLVETLILPLSVSGESIFHPCVTDFFTRLSANVPPPNRALPRRIYIDRTKLAIRPLSNEPDLIRALSSMGFHPIRLEDITLPDQIALFSNAEAIVSPHGAGLTNIGFARPGCVVIELLVDSYVDWSFRNLAALGGLRYDCVIGRARGPWGDLDANIHATQWTISVNHVVAAVAQSMMVTARAA